MLNGLLQKVFGKSGTSNVAKKRLKFALIYDQLEVSEESMEHLQHDIVEVISRYFEIDQHSLKLDIERGNGYSALVVNTPILSARSARNRRRPAKAAR